MTTDGNPSVWRKSSHSGNTGDCVEVADGVPGVVPVRDSKDPARGHLTITSAAWATMVENIRR